MRCFTDTELQALADGEMDAVDGHHVDDCVRCRERLESARRAITEVASVLNSEGDLSLHARTRVRRAIADSASTRGSTRLRPGRSPQSWKRRALVSALATAAVIMVMVFAVMPRFGAPTTLSASEVLGRSLKTLSATEGIEFLEYELVLEGVAQGSWRIEQVIDYAQPARFRLSVFSADGALHSAFSQDPSRRRRSHLFRVDGRNYIVHADGVRSPVLSLPQMGQALVETAVGLMQASADQRLSVVDGADGRRYIVEIPPVQSTKAAATLELFSARIAVRDGDFRIEQFEASGALLRQPFSVAFRLLRRTVAQNVSSGEFGIAAGPDDVVLNGEASEDVPGEFLTTLVRGLASNRGAR
jgi:hypothetical protein